MHGINQNYVSKLDDRDAGNEQVVLVDVVGLPNLPKFEIPSFIRLYDVEHLQHEQRESLHYSSVRWSFFAGSGLHKGPTEGAPSLLGWEAYSFRAGHFCPHHARHYVIQRGAHAIEGVANGENEVPLNAGRLQPNKLMPSLCVRIIDQRVEVAFQMSGEPALSLLNVVVGPIDLQPGLKNGIIENLIRP